MAVSPRGLASTAAANGIFRLGLFELIKSALSVVAFVVNRLATRRGRFERTRITTGTGEDPASRSAWGAHPFALPPIDQYDRHHQFAKLPDRHVMTIGRCVIHTRQTLGAVLFHRWRWCTNSCCAFLSLAS